MVPEAPIERTESGAVQAGDGWYTLSARDARWFEGHFGAFTRFGENEPGFSQLGINIGVLQPGQPACMYHREEAQEDFLVLHGEAILLIEGEERAVKAWDFVHCPSGTTHVFIGAGDGPCAILAVGSRTGGGVVYPESELAQRHNAGVEEETAKPREAYASFPRDAETSYRDGWLPD